MPAAWPGGFPFAVARRSALSKVLDHRGAVIVDSDEITSLAACCRDDDPNEAPDQAGEDRENCVEGVINGLAVDHDCFEVCLGFDSSSLNDLSADSFSKGVLSLFSVLSCRQS